MCPHADTSGMEGTSEDCSSARYAWLLNSLPTPVSALTDEQRQAEKRKVFADHAAVLEQMRRACSDRNLKALMDLYPRILATQALTRDDTRKMAQTIHYCMRSTYSLPEPVRHDLLPFVRKVIQDLQEGNLPPHPTAYVHLLGMYKERGEYERGCALWRWLAQQDDQHVSQAVYGAAIELLAHGKQLSLPELEGLYLDALQRFPGTFAQYHLSPDAIVPNRSQPTIIPNLPMTLLQGILDARILYNDWRNAYLALDTALRLYPSQLPARFFDLFVNNRPLNEAYTVFLVACRAGNVRPPGQVTALLANIKEAMDDCEALQDRIILLRASANAIYAHLEAGGTLDPIPLASFLTSFGSLLPEPAPGTDFEGDMALLRNRIVTFAHGLLSSLFQAGVSPSPNAFTALVHLAGKLRVPDLLRVSLQDIRTAHVDIGEIGLRTVLTSAGQTHANDLIEETWVRIAHDADAQGKQIHWRDWITLSKACRNAHHSDYFRTQLVELEHAIHPKYRDMVVATLDDDPPQPGKALGSLDLEAFDANLDALDKQFKNITAIIMSGQRLDIRQTPFYMSLNPQKIPLANVHDLRIVYDEYTVDQHQPPQEHTPSAFSSTGIPLDELRFANWVSVVELMDQANSRDNERRRMIALVGSDVPQSSTKGLLHDGRTSTLTLDRLRARIKILRETPIGPSRISKNPLAKLNYDRRDNHISHTENPLGTAVPKPTAE